MGLIFFCSYTEQKLKKGDIMNKPDDIFYALTRPDIMIPKIKKIIMPQPWYKMLCNRLRRQKCNYTN